MFSYPGAVLSWDSTQRTGFVDGFQACNAVMEGMDDTPSYFGVKTINKIRDCRGQRPPTHVKTMAGGYDSNMMIHLSGQESMRTQVQRIGHPIPSTDESFSPFNPCSSRVTYKSPGSSCKQHTKVLMALAYRLSPRTPCSKCVPISD